MNMNMMPRASERTAFGFRDAARYCGTDVLIELLSVHAMMRLIRAGTYIFISFCVRTIFLLPTRKCLYELSMDLSVVHAHALALRP